MFLFLLSLSPHPLTKLAERMTRHTTEPEIRHINRSPNARCLIKNQRPEQHRRSTELCYSVVVKTTTDTNINNNTPMIVIGNFASYDEAEYEMSQIKINMETPTTTTVKCFIQKVNSTDNFKN